MGRCLNWFIISKQIEHDKKLLCFDLEFELEDGEINDLINNKLNNQSYNYLYDKNYRDLWCPKCHLYSGVLYNSKAIIKHKEARHSYSNSIWNSDWNIQNFIYGDVTTDFIRRFDKNNLYSEIFKHDIDNAFESIKSEGTPIRRSDEEAYNESIEILTFLRDNIGDNRVIMQNEI
jgi:hypothetical protein